jgi:hypothetical protein
MGTCTICSNLSVATATSNYGSTDARVPLDSALVRRTLDVGCRLLEQRKKRVASIKIRWIVTTAVTAKHMNSWSIASKRTLNRATNPTVLGAPSNAKPTF